MRESYSQQAVDEFLAVVGDRCGWDFSAMSELRQPVPWDYQEVVRRYLRSRDAVLDVGTGGGERLRELAGAFGRGLGIDADPAMVQFAAEKSAAASLSF